ncbi:RagB/SusD family nutrient uptake outer membrane protein [Flammeovirga agarivorans]|uniref:RagB/SusD family nutrient uptake outer membrane protein n=1 Tax=Flammeovirga agarivorans TaxID=2726742 RepID=A0A7X8XVN3_9BACT|nr:RagB/SusD family nutrient uptake outer membrane protein [Flammeovirga agarivorans]NLR91503.1 RagB/SusD family nutrient uptake outer membrane protein [Flammeovirga agarivorans]
MNTKYIKKFGLVATVLIGMGTSCSSFLDVEPKSSWNSDNFYNSESRVDLGIAGIFSKFSASAGGYGSTLSMEMQYGTDEGYYSRGWDENWAVSLYSHVSNSEAIEESWRQLYGAVNECNQMIARLDESAFEDGQYEWYLAEARFLRAFAYYNLTSWWNEVPLRLDYTKDQFDNNKPAAELEEVYAAIEADFKYAIENLPHASDSEYQPGRPNKMAAEGLLARLYMKMAGYPYQQTQYYDSALVYTEDIIYNDGWHELTTSEDSLGYRNLFLNYIGGSSYNTKESLFEISYKNNLDIGISTMGAVGNYNGIAFDYVDGNNHPTTQKSVALTPVMNQIYEIEDRRMEWNVPMFQMNKSAKIVRVSNVFAPQNCPGKFRRWEPANYEEIDTNNPDGEEYILLTNETILSRNQTPINFPILRFSDVLLMHAEALNEVNGGPTGQAIECINRVRQRAGLGTLEEDSPSSLAGKDAFFQEIMDERLRELCFEGVRKFDLIRWNKLEERLRFTEEVMRAHPDYSETFWAMDGYKRPFINFNPAKHMVLPFPLQEININTSLNQKENW